MAIPATPDLEFKPASEMAWGTVTQHLSIMNMYETLSSYLHTYEKNLAETISCIEGSNASDIDQGTLLRLQAMVQTWGTVSATVTGIIRLVGDTLTKITQNIR
ncbi:MAG: hypothetical protein LW808_001765 [Verrucomicrobiota bacterium]|nr:MAG: hypothetical protein LW808_001765 [Verrucomicrobiota bacterium]